MFTPKNIQGALEELYDLCDPDYMVDMLVNYSEEFDDISPALLAKSFQKNAEMISEYRVLSSAGEGMPCMRSSKRTTPMPVPIPFPVGNRKGQSRKNMLPPKPVRIPLRQRLLHLRVQARQRAKQLREPRTSQKE